MVRTILPTFHLAGHYHWLKEEWNRNRASRYQLSSLSGRARVAMESFAFSAHFLPDIRIIDAQYLKRVKRPRHQNVLSGRTNREGVRKESEEASVVFFHKE